MLNGEMIVCGTFLCLGNCILLVWQHGSALQPCKCPLCRRQITLLVPAGASQRQCNDPEVSAIVGRVERYNRLFGRCDSSLFQIGIQWVTFYVDIICNNRPLSLGSSGSGLDLGCGMSRSES
ncbi:hypothetical protein CK203_031578 [Vitis vinifera]|uniref:Uncharacterized protein n=1 Tax=Vitis vinifera TaxID=29760 RepID=A0A438IFV0_VITVI|nr:hypothetical protein CK203_031578 [Vitis vinifera]